MNPPPDPTQYKGQTLRSFLEAIRDYLTRSRIQPDACVGITVNELPGGVQLLGGAAADGGLVLVKSTGTIAARSGTHPGSGSGVLVNYNKATNTLSDGASKTLVNITGGSLGSGKYGLAWPFAGAFWVILEC